jgi:hypothetical protein
MLEALMVGEGGIDCSDVFIVCVALFLHVAQVDLSQGGHLVQAEGFFYLVQCDFLGGL